MRYDPNHIFYTLFSFDLCLDKLLYQSKIVSLYVNKLLTFHILVQRTVTIRYVEFTSMQICIYVSTRFSAI